MAFAIAGSVVGGDILAAGMTDAVIAGLADSAAASALTAGVVEAGAGALGGELVSGGVNAAVDAMAGNTAVADTLAAGPAATVEAPGSVTTTAPETQTHKIAQQLVGNPAQDLESANAAQANAPTPDELNPNPSVAPEKPGIIDSVTKWATKNPIPATIVGTQLAGAVGGIGKAALEKEIAERNIRARSALVTQQSEQQLAQSRAGTLARPRVAQVPAGPLRRPDGSLVYPPNSGIINRAIPPG